MPFSAAHLIVIVADSYSKLCARLDPDGLQREERKTGDHCAFAVLSNANGRGKVREQLRTWNFLLNNQDLKHVSLMDAIVKGKPSNPYSGQISACSRKQLFCC